MTPQTLALLVFIVTYVGFFTLSQWRGYIAMIGAGAVLALGLLTPDQAWASIPWAVLLIFAGVLVLAEALVASNAPKVAAEKIVRVSPNAGVAMMMLCVLASFVSIFIENIACVLIMAPLGAAIATRLKVSAAPVIIGIAVCSNLQGTGTLIGDPPSMLLANALKMNFNQFFFIHGQPSIFWAVQAGAVASMSILYLFFRNMKGDPGEQPVERVLSWIPLGLLVFLVVGLMWLSFQHNELDMKSGIFCFAIGLASAAWIHSHDKTETVKMLIRLDYQTFFFLLGSFVVVKSVEHAGWLISFASFIAEHAGTNLLTLFVLLISVSVLFSAFVANEPYLIAMLPVTATLATTAGIDSATNPVLHFGLLIGASLGGNITPIGSSACIVAYGYLQKMENEKVGFKDFLRIGLPFTIAAVAAGGGFLWLVWKPVP
jgi:Na+/H+ antiporter NhaD/arsenite permease-like protein